MTCIYHLWKVIAEMDTDCFHAILTMLFHNCKKPFVPLFWELISCTLIALWVYKLNMSSVLIQKKRYTLCIKAKENYTFSLALNYKFSLHIQSMCYNFWEVLNLLNLLNPGTLHSIELYHLYCIIFLLFALHFTTLLVYYGLFVSLFYIPMSCNFVQWRTGHVIWEGCMPCK